MNYSAGQKVIWDGQSGNMTRTTANQAMIAQQQRKNYDDQFRTIQDLELNQKKAAEAQKQQVGQARMANLQQVAGVGGNTQVAGPFLPGQDRAKPDIGGMEGTKKARTDESHLIPEEMWLMMNPVRNIFNGRT